MVPLGNAIILVSFKVWYRLILRRKKLGKPAYNSKEINFFLNFRAGYDLAYYILPTGLGNMDLIFVSFVLY